MVLKIPSGTFNEHTIDVATVFGLLFDVFVGDVIEELEIEGELIDGDGVLSGKVLEHTGNESLREEETGDPEDLWSAVVDPIVQKDDSLVEIFDP